ncbi:MULTISPECIES: oxidoreductase [unclassified Corynebacterium]|uniref:oxidoreductase n=1 Tax=unclassified Corynebacterium TaxID=2624378 RepID=UPI001FEEACC8|nr:MULTISPECIES: oxidoreductase [unclassified Corynebacterium]
MKKMQEEDVQFLVRWTTEHMGVEGFVEPETLINEMSIVLVDITGEFTRRRIGGPRSIDMLAQRLDIPIYDVEETGYPQRMREKIERDRILKKRAEQKKRREKFEREYRDKQ